MTHSTIFVISLLAALTTTQAPKPLKPGADPSGPQWQGTLKLSDGRTFVTDGGLAIDAALAKPATLPARELSAKILEDYLNATRPTEVALSDLAKSGARGYAAPNGIQVNAIYVEYLRRTLPASRVKLRMGKNTEPIPILLDGKPVGVLMALAPVK